MTEKIIAKAPRLLLVLGDQLSLANPILRDADPTLDIVLFAEVVEEATYVPHNRHKIVLLFSAMRHFSQSLQQRGFQVIYRRWSDGVASLFDACRDALQQYACASVAVCSPGEYRLLAQMADWSSRLGVPVAIRDDDRFLAKVDDFRRWAAGRKQLRMEYFYREMRKRYRLLLDGDEPCGGKWNYDADNRVGWRNQEPIPARQDQTPDAVTREVIDEVMRAFPDNPGDLTLFRLAVTHEGAEAEFQWFLEHALARFGTYQDALVDDSPWVFHSLISMYINCGLLEPLAVCEAVERRYREGACSLAAAEGFIRQILGWREYVRGVYWLLMPEYAERNTFAAQRPLPDWFWTAKTPMRCVSHAVAQSLDHGYAHHIQRLMVIGNFALLTGLDVKAVCEWYLAVYVDAYEWVELPNTAGMALHADGGAMASKPYAASGKYIQKQGDHCKKCAFNPAKMTGEDACPFNSLYWRFIDRHADYLEKNARMGLILANWRKRDPESQQTILSWAEHCLARHA